jgi:hypothetical protein
MMLGGPPLAVGALPVITGIVSMVVMTMAITVLSSISISLALRAG